MIIEAVTIARRQLGGGSHDRAVCPPRTKINGERSFAAQGVTNLRYKRLVAGRTTGYALRYVTETIGLPLGIQVPCHGVRPTDDLVSESMLIPSGRAVREFKMSDTEFQRGYPSKAAAGRGGMNMDEIASQFATIARPLVRTVLHAEAAAEGVFIIDDGAIGLLLLHIAGEVAGVAHGATAAIARHILEGVGVGHGKLVGFAHPQGCSLHFGRKNHSGCLR